MAIKDLLLPLTSYPTPTGSGAIENAVGLAAGLGAKLSAVTFELDIRSPIGLYADALNIGGILAAERQKCATNARNLLSAFKMIAIQRGIAHEHHTERCMPAELARRLVARSRVGDLTLFALSAEDDGRRSVAEELIFESGRPVLIFPDEPKRELAALLTNVAIAWDCSRPAARAVADAMPFLQRAKTVQVFTVVDDKVIDKSASGAMLLKHLETHGIGANLEELKSGGRAIEAVFAEHLGLRNVELLVMGAYGHSRMREFVLGGATASILRRPPGWVLLSH